MKAYAWPGAAAAIGIFLGVLLTLWLHPGPDPGPTPDPSKENPIVVPGQVNAEVGRITRVKAKSLGPITWIIQPDTEKKLDVEVNGDSLLLVPTSEGSFFLGLVTLVDGKVTTPIWIMVQCGNGPRPPPGPTPPPPGPAPLPEDDFTKSLKAAWQAETSPTKDQDRKLLVSLYRASVNNTPPEKTLGDFNATMKAAGKSLVGERILPVRQVVAKELSRLLPEAGGNPMDAAMVAKVKDAFTRVANSLENLP